MLTLLGNSANVFSFNTNSTVNSTSKMNLKCICANPIRTIWCVTRINTVCLRASQFCCSPRVSQPQLFSIVSLKDPWEYLCIKLCTSYLDITSLTWKKRNNLTTCSFSHLLSIDHSLCSYPPEMRKIVYRKQMTGYPRTVPNTLSFTISTQRR